MIHQKIKSEWSLIVRINSLRKFLHTAERYLAKPSMNGNRIRLLEKRTSNSSDLVI